MRIAGETTDADGRRGFVLALQTRDIRREKATHNICTSQALNALGGVIHLAWLGKRGLVELGELMVRRRPTRASVWRRLTASSCSIGPGSSRVRDHRRRARSGVLDACAADGIAAKVAARPRLSGAPERAARSNHRRRSRAISIVWPNRLSEHRAGAGSRSQVEVARGFTCHMPPARERPRMSQGSVKPPTTADVPTPMQRERATTIFERSVEGRRAAVLPPLDVPETPLGDLIPRTSCVSGRRNCPRSQSRRSSATTTGSRAATSTSTPGPIRWGRAR